MMNNKSYSYVLTFVSPLIIIFFYLIYQMKISIISIFATNIICISFIIIMILGILSFYYEFVIYIIPIIFQILLCIVATNENVIITSLYIFPIVLAFYTKNNPYIYTVIGLNVISYIISNCIKYSKIDPRNPIIGSIFLGIIYLFELTIIIGSLISYVKDIKETNKELNIKNRESLRIQQDMIKFCVNSLSYHSPYLKIHTRNVAFYTTLILQSIGKKYKLSDKYKDDCILGALVHDMGKIYISDSILDKPSKLTNEEFNMIKSHVTKGVELFSSIPYNALDRKTYNICINCIKYHHERLDGNGYMGGLTNKEIPLEAKIIAIADTLDALLSYRSYKEPTDFVDAFEILKDDTLFNQKIVLSLLQYKDEIIKYANNSNEILKKEIFK